MKKKFLILFVILLIFNSGCAQLSRSIPGKKYSPPSGESYRSTTEELASQTESEEGAFDKKNYQTKTASIRKIIKNGYLTIKVKDSALKMKEIENLAQKMEGYVVSSSISGTEEKLAQITIKVPQLKFNLALDEISKMGEVISLNTSSEDVTEEYIDLEGRLTNLTIEKKRIYEILKMAKNVNDVLLIEKELARVQGEIEGIQGRLKYLKNRTDLATIEVKILGELAPTPPKGFWDIGQTLKNAFRSFLSGIKFLINFIIWVVIFIPIIVIFIVIFIILVILIKVIFTILWKTIFKRKK